MNYLTFVSRREQSAPALAEATRQDLRALNAALADERRREIAETILALAAELVSEDSVMESGELLSSDARAALARMGLTDAEPLSDAALLDSVAVRQGLAWRARMIE